MKHICIYCRTYVLKPGVDTYICRNCENKIKIAELDEKFAYISGNL